MKLSELIQHVGDEHVQLQNFDQSLVRAQAKTRDGEITFATDRSHVMERAFNQQVSHVGLVVWLPVHRLPESMRPKQVNKAPKPTEFTPAD
jgi:hypothetical protein